MACSIVPKVVILLPKRERELQKREQEAGKNTVSRDRPAHVFRLPLTVFIHKGTDVLPDGIGLEVDLISDPALCQGGML